MKILTFLLVLINILFFAYSQGQTGNSDNVDALRPKQQLNPELVVVLSSGKPPGSSNSASCLAWPQLSKAQSEQSAQAAVKASGQDNLTRSIEALNAEQWWVMIPPQSSALEAQKKGDQLHELGITQFSIVHDGSAQQNALSLGLFESEAAASAYLSGLQTAGVRSAKISKRARNSVWMLQIRAPDTTLQTVRGALNSLQPDIQPRPCAGN